MPRNAPRPDRHMLENLEDRRLLSGETETIVLEVDSTPQSVVFADFTGDGAPDTAVLAPDAGAIQIWSHDGQGGMFEWAVVEGDFAAAERIQVIDVNADWIPDLGFFDADNHRFTTYVNNADATFSFAGGLQLADTATGFVLMYHGGPVGEPVGPWIGPADFGSGDDGFGDGDGGDGSGGDGSGGDGSGGDGSGDFFQNEPHFVGDPFIAVWHDSLAAVEIYDSIQLLPADGSGGGSSGEGGGDENVVAWPFEGAFLDMPSGVYFNTGSGGDAIAVGDFNHDRQPDIAFTNRDDGTVSIIHFDAEIENLLGAGFDPATDAFIESDTIAVGAEPVHINHFDVNNDGWMDLLVANAGDGTITIAYGSDAGFVETATVDVAPDLTQVFINFNAFDHDLFVLGFSANGTVSELHFNGTSLELDKQEVGFLPANDTVLPRQIIVGEFTADPFIDVAIIDQAGQSVVIYSNVAGEAEDDSGDDYGGPPIDAADIPIAGVPDLLPATDTGASDSDNITAFNNAGENTLLFDVKVSHVADDLAALRTTLVTFFEANGEQFDEDGFQYTPTLWVNIYAGGVLIGSAEVVGGQDTIVVRTDGRTVLREGMHAIRAGFAIGAPGLRGLVGTRSAALPIEVRVPRVEVDTSGAQEGETVTIRKDDAGNFVLLLEVDDGQSSGIEEVSFGLFEDLPPITGSVVTVKETKRNAGASRYAAGQSDEGLVLLVRSDEGQWSGRNLTAEIDDSEPITDSNIEVMTTPWGNVNMAGLNEQGELIFYWQDGGADQNGQARWNFVNLADNQLRDNGQAVPSYASSLESFVTPWGAMNVAGLDANGHLRVIWWAPGRGHWVSTDLTELLGSTPLTGDVSAWVTPWGGINLVGLNTDGEMVAVWWAPGQDWTVSPIGETLGAPTLVHGSLASFVSERGDTFVAGLTTEGDVGIFSWNLDDFAWDYAAVAGIPDTATLVGSVSGYFTEADSSVTLLVGSLDGSVFELLGDGLGIQDAWTVGLYDSAGDDA